MQYFGVPICPYCKKRVNLIRTWSLKRQGEYKCPRCGGTVSYTHLDVYKRQILYNPLFIYGNSGLGKTHLLYAVSKEVHKSFPQMSIVYIKGDDFTNEMIEAIKSGTTAAFREKYRHADLFLVDDIQFIAGKESTQEEFFHTFNTLYEAKKQIVLTSDRPPKDIATLDDRLKTRFEWGLTADIQPPDFETRIAIITRKAESLGFTIPDNVCEYIANKLKSNIRQLEGAVKKLRAFYLLESKPINLSLIHI